ncbi:MAG: hypothetical protein H6679_03885 [Epsilonproteobacteria bacterium]|nr:hypothetical protein [Campylobacterota bacterium]
MRNSIVFLLFQYLFLFLRIMASETTPDSLLLSNKEIVHQTVKNQVENKKNHVSIVQKLQRYKSYLPPKLHWLLDPYQEHGVKKIHNALFFELSFAHNFTDHCFNKIGKKTGLAECIFGKEFLLRDIFLASKLAAKGKFSLGGGTGFGNSPTEQYIYCLSPTKILIDAEQKEFIGHAHGLFYFRIPYTKKLLGGIGAQLTVKDCRRTMELRTQDGRLFCSNTFASGENSLSQFFSDFNMDFFDFFTRGVTNPKLLTFQPKQQKRGIGDLSIFTLVNFAPYLPNTYDCALGMNVVLPTASKKKGFKVWEITLGNRGGVEVGAFLSGSYHSSYSFFHPFFYANFSYVFPHSSMERVPEQKTDPSQVLVPPRFNMHTIASFNEFDTTVLEFADESFKTHIRNRWHTSFLIGNYWHNVFRSNITFGVSYSAYIHNQPTVRVPNFHGRFFNTALIADSMKHQRHCLSWSAKLSYSNNTRISLGFKHTFAGRNASAYDEVHGSLVFLI